MSDKIEFGKLSDREILILLAEGQKVYEARLNDHGKRLRALETFRNWATGAGAAAAGIAGLLKLNVRIGQGS